MATGTGTGGCEPSPHRCCPTSLSGDLALDTGYWYSRTVDDELVRHSAAAGWLAVLVAAAQRSGVSASKAPEHLSRAEKKRFYKLFKRQADTHAR